tara:strand:+ start:772 stop:1593 length:822 start_codon:yes stop_codon:yes gene_type:complete
MKYIQTNWYKKAKYEDFDKWDDLKDDHKDYLIEEMFDQGRIDSENKSETFVGLNKQVERPEPKWTEDRSFDLQWKEVRDGHFESNKIHLKNKSKVGWEITSVGGMFSCMSIIFNSNDKPIGELPLLVREMSEEEAKKICENHANGLKHKDNWEALNRSVSRILSENKDGDMHDEPEERENDEKMFTELAFRYMADHSLISLPLNDVLQKFMDPVKESNHPIAKLMSVAAIRLREFYLEATKDPSKDFSLDMKVDENSAKMLAWDLGRIMNELK